MIDFSINRMLRGSREYQKRSLLSAIAQDIVDETKRIGFLLEMYNKYTSGMFGAFATNNLLIKINLIKNDTERSEHLGLMNAIKGLFGIIRNPTAHEPKIKFLIEER